MKRKELTTLLAQKRDTAMPEVKALVKKHGRVIVGWCLSKMREYDLKVKALDAAKKQVQDLEKSL